MPEADALEHILTDILPNAGVAGVLALVMFYFLRRDGQQHEQRYEELLRQQKSMMETVLVVVKDNTASNTGLSTVIEGLQRQFERDR